MQGVTIVWCDWLCEIKSWQTLISGMIALGAAAWTVRAIRHQTQRSDDNAKEIRRRKARAARAAMPAALSSLTAYTVQCVALIVAFRRSTDSTGAIRPNMDLRSRSIPLMPQETLANLKECIEFADDQPAARISRIFKKLQIQNSRLRGFIDEACGRGQLQLIEGSLAVVTTQQADGCIFDAAELYAEIAKLFEYAREDAETVKEEVDLPSMERTLFFLGITEPSYSEVYQIAARRYS